MAINLVIDTEDKSVYADKLSEWTGKSRNAWSFVSLGKLKSLYYRMFFKQRRNQYAEKIRMSRVKNDTNAHACASS